MIPIPGARRPESIIDSAKAADLVLSAEELARCSATGREPVSRSRSPVIIVGGGHNGLVAAAYLARAGRRGHGAGGARRAGRRGGQRRDLRRRRRPAVAVLLPGLPAAASRSSTTSDSDLELRSRRVTSYTPVGDGGLLVERPAGARTRESFADLTGGRRRIRVLAGWRAICSRLAAVVAPTLTEPLPRAADLRRQVAASSGRRWSSGRSAS